MYTDVGGTEVRYCADTCDDENQCDEGETCILEEQVCVADPCPSVARCVPDEETAYEEVGCFKDTRHDRVLGSQYDSPEMSAEVSRYPCGWCVCIPCARERVCFVCLWCFCQVSRVASIARIYQLTNEKTTYSCWANLR